VDTRQENRNQDRENRYLSCKDCFDNIGSVAVVVIVVITMVICIALQYYVDVYKHVK